MLKFFFRYMPGRIWKRIFLKLISLPTQTKFVTTFHASFLVNLWSTTTWWMSLILRLCKELYASSLTISQSMTFIFCLLVGSKGQIISKANYGILNFSKKRTNKFDYTTMIPQVNLFSFLFWRKLKTPKTHMEIIWPLVRSFIYRKNE